MPLMQEKLYDAFRSAGVNEAVAREAAVEAAEHQDRTRKVESDLQVLKWMMATLIALQASTFYFVLQILARLPK